MLYDVGVTLCGKLLVVRYAIRCWCHAVWYVAGGKRYYDVGVRLYGKLRVVSGTKSKMLVPRCVVR